MVLGVFPIQVLADYGAEAAPTEGDIGIEPLSAAVSITAPAGADIRLFRQDRFHQIFTVSRQSTVTNDDGTVTANFGTTGENFHYRVSMPGMITRTGFYPDGAVNIIFGENEDPQTQEHSMRFQARAEASTMVNINQRNHLTMNAGGTFRLRGYRAAWEIIDGDMSNHVVQPDFHVNVLYGAQHINITPVPNQSNFFDISAQSAGTAIVEVHYDAIRNVIGNSDSLYGATHPDRKSVVVITIGGGTSLVNFGNWDADFDTVYYLNTQTNGIFPVNASGLQSVEVAHVSNGVLGQWQTVSADGGTHNVPVSRGNNVVRATTASGVDYQVVRAAQITPIFTNTSRPGELIGPGDQFTLRFEGLFSAAPKMANIYNPTMPMLGDPAGNRIGYTFNGVRVYGGSQYTFTNQHAMTFTAPNIEGHFMFTNGTNPTSIYGRDFGRHRTLGDNGTDYGIAAPTFTRMASILPDIPITIGTPANGPPDDGTIGDKGELIAIIAEANILAEIDFTPASWSVLQTALAAAIVVNNNANATQGQVDAAVSALEAAIDALELYVSAGLLPRDDAYYLDGWFVVHNPNGEMHEAIHHILTRYHRQPVDGPYNYSVVRRLRVTGNMAQTDFFAGAAGTNSVSNGLLRSSTQENVANRTPPILNRLTDLDFSGLTELTGTAGGNFPNTALFGLSSLERLRMPADIGVSASTIRGASSLRAIVFGDGEFTEDTFDFRGIEFTSDFPTWSFTTVPWPNRPIESPFPGGPRRIILPSDRLVAADMFRQMERLEEVIFVGDGSANINANAFASNANLHTVHFYSDTAPGTIAATAFSNINPLPVAIVPDRDEGGYELAGFRTRFYEVVSRAAAAPIDRDGLNAAIAEANALTQADFTPVSWAILRITLTEAIAVRYNENASQVDVDAARDNLQAAIDGLAPYVPTVDEVTVYISFEGFNLGHGFYIEPMRLTLPGGSRAMNAVDTALAANSLTRTGGADFVARINNIHPSPGETPNVPSFITDALQSIGMILDVGATDGSLGSADYTSFSGWMYTANHVIPYVRVNGHPHGFGLNDFILSNGDVIRIQFSVFGMGQDLGIEDSWVGPPLYIHADKTQLIRTLFVPNVNEAAVPNAHAVIINPLATPEQVAAAIEALLEGAPPQSPDELLAEAVIRVNNALAALNVTNTTTATDVLASAQTAAGTEITATWQLAPAITPAQAGQAGSIVGTIVLALDGVTRNFAVNLTIPALPTPPPAWEIAMHSALDRIEFITTNPTVESVGGEWAVLALARAGRINTDHAWTQIYLANLNAEMEELIEESLWTDLQRVTLALTSLGIDAIELDSRLGIFSTFVPTAGRPTHSQSLNADIYGLLALDSMPYGGDRLQFVQSILSAQNSNGSWSLVRGTSPGIDITAMAIQALAPYYISDYTGVRDAVNSAIAWLSAQSIPDAEGNAQMIVALTAIGRGAEASTYVDALLTFYDNATGGFIRGPGVNAMTTEQAAYALVAYWRYVNGHNRLYDMRDAFGDDTPTSTHVNRAALRDEITQAGRRVQASYTPASWNAMQVALEAAIAVRDNLNATQIQIDTATANLRSALNALVGVGGGNQPPPPPTPARVLISVIDPNYHGPGRPHTFFAGRWMDINQGETAYSLLRRTGLTISSRGNSDLAGMYVESINGWGEFDDGPLSGWMYSVNGVFPGFSSSLYTLRDGDRVEWLFTRNRGDDLAGGAGGIGGGGAPGALLPEEDEEDEDDEDKELENGIPLADLSEWENLFRDVSEDDWFYGAVRFVNANGLMTGTGDDTFSPNTNLSRSMIVTILWRLAGEPTDTEGTTFDDVQSGRWYSSAIAWAAGNGIVNGFGDGRFAPSDDITREQLAAILMRFAYWKDLDVVADANLASFDDSNRISGWAQEAMSWANATGLITGRTETTLAPQGTATRAEAATMLMRFVENVIG